MGNGTKKKDIALLTKEKARLKASLSKGEISDARKKKLLDLQLDIQGEELATNWLYGDEFNRPAIDKFEKEGLTEKQITREFNKKKEEIIKSRVKAFEEQGYSINDSMTKILIRTLEGKEKWIYKWELSDYPGAEILDDPTIVRSIVNPRLNTFGR